MSKIKKELSTKELSRLFGGKSIRRIIIKRKIISGKKSSGSIKFNL